jgi:predicted transcriptional regulator
MNTAVCTSIRVKDFMRKTEVTFTPEMEILKAIHALIEHRITGAPVLDLHGNLVGMLTEKDCMRVAVNAAYHRDWGGHVEEYMSREVQTIDIEASIVDVAEIFLNANFRRMPVIERHRLVGQISRHDVLKAMETLR